MAVNTKRQMSNTKSHTPWVSVKEAPLFTVNERGEWECTEAGNGQFLAALEYIDTKGDGSKQWWVRHCVVMDIVGLCVITEDDAEPAGWELDDVEYYMPISTPNEASISGIEKLKQENAALRAALEQERELRLCSIAAQGEFSKPQP